MSFSHSCACNVVPLMARLVLGAAFIYAGYEKVFTDRTWTGDDAATLRQMGVSSAAATTWGGAELRLAAFRPQDQGEEGETVEEDAQDQETEEGSTQDPPLVDEPVIDEAPQPPPGDATQGGDVRARKLYDVALKVRRAGVDQYETILAWGTALVELVGGALILIGLFTRIWGFALALVMAGAFYTTSWFDFSADPYAYLGDHFDLFFSQVGRFVLAFGVFLTGAGAISADRMLFKHGHDEHPDVDLT